MAYYWVPIGGDAIIGGIQTNPIAWSTAQTRVPKTARAIRKEI